MEPNMSFAGFCLFIGWVGSFGGHAYLYICSSLDRGSVDWRYGIYYFYIQGCLYHKNEQTDGRGQQTRLTTFYYRPNVKMMLHSVYHLIYIRTNSYSL